MRTNYEVTFTTQKGNPTAGVKGLIYHNLNRTGDGNMFCRIETDNDRARFIDILEYAWPDAVIHTVKEAPEMNFLGEEKFSYLSCKNLKKEKETTPFMDFNIGQEVFFMDRGHIHIGAVKAAQLKECTGGLYEKLYSIYYKHEEMFFGDESLIVHQDEIYGTKEELFNAITANLKPEDTYVEIPSLGDTVYWADSRKIQSATLLALESPKPEHDLYIIEEHEGGTLLLKREDQIATTARSLFEELMEQAWRPGEFMSCDLPEENKNERQTEVGDEVFWVQRNKILKGKVKEKAIHFAGYYERENDILQPRATTILTLVQTRKNGSKRGDEYYVLGPEAFKTIEDIVEHISS